jgi:hypothetical protein
MTGNCSPNVNTPNANALAKALSLFATIRSMRSPDTIYAMAALWLSGIAPEWRRGFSDSEDVLRHADD